MRKNITAGAICDTKLNRDKLETVLIPFVGHFLSFVQLKCK